VDGTSYYYRVEAEDLAGNRTVSAVYGPVISINNNGSDVTAPEEVTELSGTPGDGFMHLSWTGSIDTALDLVDQLVDISADGGITWGITGPGYSDGGFLSLGKEADFYLAEGLANGTDYRFRIRVKDSSGNISAGTLTGVLTPSAAAVTTVSGTIASDTTWAAGVFYVSSNITVSAGVTLTIEPGVVVKFGSSRSMTVNGTLTAVGTAGNPVVFTAYTDDSYGGDSNGNGPSDGTPGYWGRIYFNQTSTSRLEHAVVRYGGSSGQIYMNYSDVSVISCEISDSSTYGIATNQSSPLIEGTTISNNGSFGIYQYYGSPVVRNNTITGNRSGIYAQYSTPVIDGNIITGNSEYGIYFYDARNAPEITNNTITGNDKPVRLPFSSLPGDAAGNVLAPNTKNQIEFYGNTLDRNMVLPASPVNIYYQL
jgi:parallel beta-helix repeat protein